MLLDNQKKGKVGDALKSHLGPDSNLSLITGYISLYGFQSLQRELQKSNSLRLLITQAQSHAPYLEGDPFENKLKNQLEQKRIAQEFSQWLTQYAEIKSMIQPGVISQCLYHVQNRKTQDVAIQGASNLTSSGLGYTKSENHECNHSVEDQNETAAVLNWFDSLWNNSAATKDIKAELLEQLDRLIKNQPPKFIYFLCLYDIEKIIWAYSFKPETIHIAAYQDETREYQEIALIQVNLQKTTRRKRLAEIIHRTIPYPIWLVFVDGNKIVFSIGTKRINQADKEKIKVDQFGETDWIDLTELTAVEQEFLNSCAVNNFSYANFLAFHQDLEARIIGLKSAKHTGIFEIKKEDRTERLTQIHGLEQKITEQKAQIKREEQFNRKVELNINIKELEKELRQTQAKL